MFFGDSGGAFLVLVVSDDIIRGGTLETRVKEWTHLDQAGQGQELS